MLDNLINSPVPIKDYDKYEEDDDENYISPVQVEEMSDESDGASLSND